MPFFRDPTFPFILGELGLNLAGLALLWRIAIRPAAPAGPSPLSPWSGPWSELLLFLLCALGGGFAAGFVMAHSLHFFAAMGDNMRLLAAWGGLQLGVLAGAAAFYFGFRRRGAPPLRPNIRAALGTGALTFLVCLPVINAVSFAWQALLKAGGFPIEPQAAVELFLHTHSLVERGLLVLLAAGGAPLMEEILFRAGLFRYLRTRLPRWAAYLIPALIFGAAHGSLAFFAPLAVLGLIFSAAYERTGRIGTTIVAHGLFNLNTIAMVLVGLGN